MPFYEIDTDQTKLQKLKPTDFESEKFLERQHLQPLLRDKTEAIDSGIFIISEEFSNWEDSKRRIDLLGLDEEGNLVVIELKRVQEGAHMELQALRYAAMVSAMDFEAVIDAHEQFLTKLGRDSKNARSEIRKFLELEDSEDGLISNNPRIILIAPSFSQEITTTVLWLNGQGIDIRCMEVILYDIKDSKFLNVEQIIPLPSAADYQIKIREKTNQAVREVSTRQKRREKTIKILVENSILQEGTRVYLIRSPKPELDLNHIEDKAKHATFQKDSQKFKWDLDESSYSISGLCKALCEKYHIPVGSGAFPGPEYWAIENENKSLSERAKQKYSENND
ncbi:hypothetical protein MC7420_5237 [Coleofasciculus chthonoplastes PCC 7420]|uniref:DUF91 domain-containing protein n=1 Tax=Coleofasciculus chthonoplastes PCC 7420 TaxID=118168 RepID=B4W2P5_9CYAN|nr:hypothetical protein [Coleofasciculus chthonoplastes]EDX71612.1 hypothetical protein MC7420_5237 [Coleofasciculus chthonoplastes PCC 7420]